MPTLERTSTSEYKANPQRIQEQIALLNKYLHPDRYEHDDRVHIFYEMTVGDRMLEVKKVLSEAEYKEAQGATQAVMAWLYLDILWFRDNIHSLGFTKDPTTHENLVVDLILDGLRFLIYYNPEKNDNPIAYVKWLLNIRKALFIKKYQRPEVSMTGFEENIVSTQAAPMTEEELEIEALAQELQDAARDMKSKEIQQLWNIICEGKTEAQRRDFCKRQLRKLRQNKPYSPNSNRARTVRRMTGAFAMTIEDRPPLAMLRAYFILAK
jgi:hypothetical protein